MKIPIAVVAVLAVVLSACSCSSDSDTTLETEMLMESLEKGVIVMEPGEDYSRTGFRLRVDSVMNDSRCPEDAYCIWGGNVEVAFNLALSGRPDIPFLLNTNSSFRRDTVIQGVRYKLIDVSPYPRSDSQIEYEDYRVTVSVGE